MVLLPVTAVWQLRPDLTHLDADAIAASAAAKEKPEGASAGLVQVHVSLHALPSHHCLKSVVFRLRIQQLLPLCKPCCHPDLALVGRWSCKGQLCKLASPKGRVLQGNMRRVENEKQQAQRLASYAHLEEQERKEPWLQLDMSQQVWLLLLAASSHSLHSLVLQVHLA